MRRFVFYCIFCMSALLAANTLAAQKTLYPNTFLYRISGKDLTKPSYLYGTMHLQDRRIFQFSDSLYYFLEHADGYAMEVDPNEIFAALMQSLSQPDTSGLLKDVMDEKDFKKIAGNLEAQFGVSADKITRKQAWLYKQGWKNKVKTKPDDMDAVMDMYLYNIARRQGKWVGGIEDVEDQLNMLNELGARFNGDDLGVGVHVDISALEKLIKLYAAQDLNKIYDWCRTMDSIDREGMLEKRNKKMARRIDSLAHIRSCFFTVGAAHLPGSLGLIRLLKEAGYQVDAVLSKKKVAPETYHYKEQELPWYTVENEEKTYEVVMPGKAIPFSPYSDIIKMKVYADMGTGIFYFITSVQAPAEKKMDSVLAQMAKNYARSGNNIKPSKIVYNGKQGLETICSTSGYHYRIRLLAEGRQVVIMMTGSLKNELLHHKEAEKFFQSLKFNPESISKSSTEWYQYADEERAIEVSFPSKPSFSKDYHQGMMSSGSEGWAFTNQVYLDLLNQVYYLLSVSETTPSYYITNEEEVLSGIRKNLEKNGNVTIVKHETGEFNGYPFLRLDGRNNENGLMLKIFSVIRGNRNFNLMVFSENNADTVSINKFLSSLQFRDFKKQEWKKYADSSNSFTTVAPAPAITESNNDQPTGSTKNSIFYDKMSGFSFQVNAEALSPYFWAKNDSIFFAGRVANYVTDGDSVYNAKKVRNGDAEGMEYRIRIGKDGRKFKRLRILLNGDTVYSIFLIAPQRFQEVAEYDRFFSDFRFNQYQPNRDIFTNKTARILEDLNSADSVTIANAKTYIDKAPFTKDDLQLLHKALLQPYGDFGEGWNSTHNLLLNKVVEIADESTVDFIQQSCPSLSGEKEELKYSFLRGLARIATHKSYTVLKELLIKHLPAKGEPGGLGSIIAGHRQLAKALFPEILPLVSDSTFCEELVIMCNSLLDSNQIQIEALRPYEAGFLQQAKHVYKNIKSEEDEYSWGMYKWITLAGKFNDAQGNQWLQVLTTSGMQEIKFNAALELIKNNQVVAPVILEKMAADKTYRLPFYETCREYDKLKLFPARYLNQRTIAESQLYFYASDDAEPSKMEYIGERKTVYEGKVQKFYLFKIQYTYDDSSSESYLGVAGPYTSTQAAILTEATATGLYHQSFNPKQVDEQLKAYLKELEEYAKESE